MSVLAVIIAAIFVISFLALPRLDGGWFWDLGNGLGLLAMAGLLFQMIPCRRGRTLKQHERLGYAVLALAMAHAFWRLARQARQTP